MHDSSSQHIPVLAAEVVEWLRPASGQTFVDGTLGGGGHTLRLLAKVGESGTVIACDRDADAVREAKAILPGRTRLLHANYADLNELLAQGGITGVHGILLDLGISSDQLADQDRGFSFQTAGALDLRFDTTRGEPAWRLLQRLSAEHLADIIYEFGEERLSRRIARAIVRQRQTQPIKTANQLAEIIRRVVPRSRTTRIDPATRTFQALRIYVNEELKWLRVALDRLPDCLLPEGRLAIISFHSLEDRLVKEAFRDDARLNVLTRRPIRAGEAEVQQNPRSRSAKLRIAERTAEGGD